MFIARLRGAAVIVNYRGGNADPFFARAPGHVLRSLRAAALRVTPSRYLLGVFGRYGLDAQVIPNIVDLSRFKPVPRRDFGNARGQFLQGNYAQTVAGCRMVLESLTKELKQEDEIKASKAQHKTDRTALSVDQRELVLRQAAIDYSSLAHHVDGGVPEELYDRRSAQMLLAMTAALIGSALGRRADGERQRL